MRNASFCGMGWGGLGCRRAVRASGGLSRASRRIYTDLLRCPARLPASAVLTYFEFTTAGDECAPSSRRT